MMEMPTFQLAYNLALFNALATNTTAFIMDSLFLWMRYSFRTVFYHLLQLFLGQPFGDGSYFLFEFQQLLVFLGLVESGSHIPVSFVIFLLEVYELVIVFPYVGLHFLPFVDQAQKSLLFCYDHGIQLFYLAFQSIDLFGVVFLHILKFQLQFFIQWRIGNLVLPHISFRRGMFDRVPDKILQRLQHGHTIRRHELAFKVDLVDWGTRMDQFCAISARLVDWWSCSGF